MLVVNELLGCCFIGFGGVPRIDEADVIVALGIRHFKMHEVQRSIGIFVLVGFMFWFMDSSDVTSGLDAGEKPGAGWAVQSSDSSL